MHAASGTLEIHDIEFLVEEGVELDLPLLHSLIEKFKHLLVHVI